MARWHKAAIKWAFIMVLYMLTGQQWGLVLVMRRFTILTDFMDFMVFPTGVFLTEVIILMPLLMAIPANWKEKSRRSDRIILTGFIPYDRITVLQTNRNARRSGP